MLTMNSHLLTRWVAPLLADPCRWNSTTKSTICKPLVSRSGQSQGLLNKNLRHWWSFCGGGFAINKATTSSLYCFYFWANHATLNPLKSKTFQKKSFKLYMCLKFEVREKSRITLVLFYYIHISCKQKLIFQTNGNHFFHITKLFVLLFCTLNSIHFFGPSRKLFIMLNCEMLVPFLYFYVICLVM